MKFFKKTLRDVPLEGTTVLLRADYNVPLKADGSIHDDFRIRASLPTIRRLLKDGCKVVIIAHLGRPVGRDPKLSLEPAAQRLAELLKEPVRFVDQTIGDKVRMAIKRAPKRGVIVLENLRFHSEEETNDEIFARSLARDSGAKYFVQDGFGVVHRDHASTAAITLLLPSVAGLLLEKEYLSIVGAMKHPKRPLVAVMGGAKVSDKIQVVDELVAKADQILIGGAMANTFLAARGYDVGASKHETDQLQTVTEIYGVVDKKVGNDQEDTFMVLPSDVAVAQHIDRPAEFTTKLLTEVQPNDMILDIGPETIKRFVSAIEQAGTVIWNGTVGYAELAVFAKGSAAIAEAMVGSGAETIIGGGDTADFAIHWDKKKGDSFQHVSTGGGASLELMAGEKLPGIEHLLDA
ncbi:phosphoglycerate kinase [Candidatus Saccharibacteria bacterium]|nr:phosphoglycerate kinase [Candidatus Saccharibacteria bacterium]